MLDNKPIPTNKSLRIAVVGMRGIPSNYSGIERVGEELYPKLAERGHQITVFARPTENTAKTSDFRGVLVVQTNILPWSPLETLSQAVTTFIPATWYGRFDLVHLHALAPALFSFGYRWKRIPTVWTIHGLDWQRAKWKGPGAVVLKQSERFGVRSVNEIIVVSSDLKKYYWENYGRATTVIHNAVSFGDIPPPGDFRIADYGLHDGQYLLFVGRIVPEKRIDDLIIAYRQVRTDCKLVIVGSGPEKYENYLRQLAQDDPRLIFTGALDKIGVYSLLRAAQAFVLPSELEGLPVALIECINQSLPAVVSDIPPHRELFEQVSEYDLFFKVRDTKELAFQISRVLNNQEKYRSIARRAQAKIQSKLLVEQMVERTEDVFQRAATAYRDKQTV